MKLRIDPVGIVILIVWLWMGNQYIQQEKELDTETLKTSHSQNK